MSPSVPTVACGPYDLVAQDEDTLFELADGSVELFAERSYLVRLGPGASDDVLRGALQVPRGGAEGTLRFENFVGLSKLGPRRLNIRSNRLDAGAVEQMLDQVCDRLASLPFGADTPTSAEYERVRSLDPDALYHAFAFLRDSMRGFGPHDLPATLERILARPHESLRLDDPRLVPIGAASRFDAETLQAIQSEPELLSPVAAGSPLASRPLARALKGTMPEFVRTRPLLHSSDNPENRFVVGALETMIDVLRRFERLVQDESRVSAALNAKEARELADKLRRFRGHPALADLAPLRKVPLQSTVLRARPGYRELLRVYTDLLGRTSRADAHAAQALLELRDAATIYEYWCYFQVVAAVGAVLGEPRGFGSFAADTVRTRVPYGYRVEWAEATVSYNETFSHAASPGQWPGSTSYSLPLRPDITLRTAAGKLHLLDAKLKIDFGRAAAGLATEQPGGRDSFKNEDLHKMHAYRDALGADSVWVLYPGTASELTKFGVPSEPGADPPPGLQGVGAAPLRPGAPSDCLRDLLSQLLEASPAATPPG